MPTIRDTITQMCQDVAKRSNRTLSPLRDDLLLNESGLDSFSVMTVIVALDCKLNLDPFSNDGAMIPNTFGELIKVYEIEAAKS